MTHSKIKVTYIPDESRAVWVFPGSLAAISVWEWEPVFRAELADFRVPGSDRYIDGNGDAITKAEAQREVDYLNGKR